MENMKPHTIMQLAGAAVLLLTTFLEWHDLANASAWNTEVYGFQGIFVAVIAIAIAGGIAVKEFDVIDLPSEILGFRHVQLHFVLGVSAFLISFGLQFQSGVGIGVTLAWLASAAIVAGSLMQMKESAA